MMLAALFIALQGAPAAPLPPVDWSNLPTLRYARPVDQTANLSAFVRAEVKAGHCPRATANPDGWTLTVDMAVLATPQQTVRRIVPRAIDCAAVEQYAAGIVSSLVRGNIDTTGTTVDGWYRTSLTFTWRS